MPIENFRIASPCSARWSLMRGDDRVRFCDRCQKNVYDFSQLTLSEIEELLWKTEGKVCARLWRLPSGQFLTADCPVGRRRKRFRLFAAFATAASVVLGFLGGERLYALTSATMGALAVDVQPPSPRSTALHEDLRSFGRNGEP